jgi:hypothetical protein
MQAKLNPIAPSKIFTAMFIGRRSNVPMLKKGKNPASLAVYISLFIFALAVPFHSAVSQEQEPEKLVPEEFKDKVQYLSTVPSMIIADSLGMTEIQGKSLDPNMDDVTDPRLRQMLQDIKRSGLSPRAQLFSIGANVGIGVHPTKHENEPTVVANPQNEEKLVAGSHFFGPPAPVINRCVVFTSSDGGRSWSEPLTMPMLTPESVCSDPVLVYAPDGNRAYYAYMDIKPPSLGGFDIVVSFSDDDGQTWVGPIIALDGTSLGPVAFMYDKPWIGTHIDVPGSQANNRFVYITATLFRIRGPIPDIAIAFTSSGNSGLSWGLSNQILDTVPVGSNVVVQGSRPIGGLGGEVLVAWYNSGSDGPLTGGFEVRTARSANNGFTFGPTAIAASDSSETPFFLGPLASFHRWWLTMFPDVEIDTNGVAHIVYTHDPVAGSVTAEDGDIRYVTSAGPPYNAWSVPITISDDTTGQAQGFPALETAEGVQHVIWHDHRLTPLPLNFLYDIFYTRNVGRGWEPNSRVTDASSLTDRDFVGDYIDLTTGSSLIFGIWTDRRDKVSIFDFEDDVWGARIAPVEALVGRR